MWLGPTREYSVSYRYRDLPISPRRARGASSRSIPDDLRSRNRLATQSIAAALSSSARRAKRALPSSCANQNQPKQNRDFHPTLVRLTRSAVRRYISARKKGGLNFLSIYNIVSQDDLRM